MLSTIQTPQQRDFAPSKRDRPSDKMKFDVRRFIKKRHPISNWSLEKQPSFGYILRPSFPFDDFGRTISVLRDEFIGIAFCSNENKGGLVIFFW